MEVLVLRPGALGDTLLAVPAVRALRRQFPAARVTLAAHGPAARFLAEVGEVDEGLPFDHPALAWLFQSDSRTTHSPERRTGLPPDPARPAVAWLSDLDGQVGRALRGRGYDPVLVAPSRPPDGSTTHCARHLLDSLAMALGDGVLGEVSLRAARLAAPLAVPSVEQHGEVLIHPGSGARRKNWPAERFAGVIASLKARGYPVCLVVGEADHAAAAAVERAHGAPLPRLTALTLATLAARLAGCRAYLGNDSGVSHLAGLVGARTTALFGPTSPAVWQPLGPRVAVLPFDVTDQEVVTALLRD